MIYTVFLSAYGNRYHDGSKKAAKNNLEQIVLERRCKIVATQGVMKR
jgi:hypothetical protein